MQRQLQPWQADPRFIKNVRISAGAAMKMLNHAKVGVDKGLASSNRFPVEVMGFLHVQIDANDPRTLIVTDAFEINAEGAEGSVVTDKPETMRFIADLGDNVGATRHGVIGGWYHSHPFDVGSFPYWFLSDTDVQSQRVWQTSEDKHFPFIALVVDPLTGLAKGRPEIGAFRTYPPTYTPPMGIGPDGEQWPDKRALEERWGGAHQSYCSLNVSYFSNPAASALMGILSRDILWARILSSTPVLEADNRDMLAGRVQKLGKTLEAGTSAVETHSKNRALGLVGLGGEGGGGGGGSSGSGSGVGSQMGGITPDQAEAMLSVGATGQMAEAAVAATSLASELLRAQAMQALKHKLFCGCKGHGGGWVGKGGGGAPASATTGSGGDMVDGEVERGEGSEASKGINFSSLATALEVSLGQVTKPENKHRGVVAPTPT